MILLAGGSFDTVTRKRYIGIATGSTNYANSPGKVGSHLFLQRMTKCITTLSF